MIYRTLGRTGLRVGAVALGCEGFAGMSAERLRAEIDFAEEAGVNFIDLYASDPELRTNLGRALAGHRDRFVIQGHLCSVWENGQYLRTRDVRKTEAAFEDLLARLKTDRMEIG
ncbi:MAG: aldo/keto reductase, partial [Alistipes sp.]|nr:aldo/keto reductase [Alistipes sp.]